MKLTLTYHTALQWFQQCEELLDIFQNDNSLTMEIEWALLQNYKSLNRIVESYNNDFTFLQNEIDVTSEEGKTQVSLLQAKKIKANIIRINHNILRGLHGVSLEIMALFDFMIT